MLDRSRNWWLFRHSTNQFRQSLAHNSAKVLDEHNNQSCSQVFANMGLFVRNVVCLRTMPPWLCLLGLVHAIELRIGQCFRTTGEITHRTRSSCHGLVLGSCQYRPPSICLCFRSPQTIECSPLPEQSFSGSFSFLVKQVSTLSMMCTTGFWSTRMNLQLEKHLQPMNLI